MTLGNTDGEISGLTIPAPPIQAAVQALHDKAEELADDVRALSMLVHALRGALVDMGCVHSFRVTWITLALAAGVPLELVQRVTGHRTVEVVMKHYFRQGRGRGDRDRLFTLANVH